MNELDQSFCDPLPVAVLLNHILDPDSFFDCNLRIQPFTMDQPPAIPEPESDELTKKLPMDR